MVRLSTFYKRTYEKQTKNQKQIKRTKRTSTCRKVNKHQNKRHWTPVYEKRQLNNRETDTLLNFTKED